MPTKYRNLDYYYSKQCYKRSLKRLMEDPSSIWYDNLEQMKKDYADMKEVYDLVCTITQSETPNPTQNPSEAGSAMPTEL